MNIQYDRYSLILDGRRTFIRSGAIHYFRLPHVNLWRDRLKKLKMAGYNTVDIYFNWDFHSKAPGQYNFTGNRDVAQLLDIVEELGLYLIARPGPYINAETTRGGLPGWLLTEPDVILRNREDGAYIHSPRYMHFVKEWYDEILPFIKGRKNLLMVQVENEYGTDEMEPDYMEALIEIVRSHGITQPTMHNDFYAAGLYADVVDLYAIDNYSVTLFDMNWRTFPDLFSVLDHLEETIRPEFCENRPLMIAELQAGWFAGWKSVSYETIHKSLGREHIGLVTRTFLGQGGTVFNHYKAIGGTNWDHIGATDAYTSYDFAAPISEAGLPTERLYEAKSINLILSHFDMTHTQRVEPDAIGLEPSQSLYTIRKDLNHEGSYWIITRNLTNTPQHIPLGDGLAIETPPYDSYLIPYQMPLANGWTLNRTTTEILAQTQACIMVAAHQPAVLHLASPEPLTTGIQMSAPVSLASTQGQTRHQIQLNRAMAPNEVSTVRLGETTIYFLGQDYQDRLWTLGDGQFLLGPDLMTSPDEAYLSKPRQCWRIAADGARHELTTPSMLNVKLPELTDWKVIPVLPPNLTDFKDLSPNGADMDANGIHEGAVWYRYQLEGMAHTLEIHAQHIWAAYINGQCLVETHTFHVHPETGGPDDALTVHIPQESLNGASPNELLIFVESLGHHKGFYDDTRDPRGVLRLAVDGQDISTAGQIARAPLCSPLPNTTQASRINSTPILLATTAFELQIPPESQCPMGLEVELDVERANICLNGVLLGKYWRSCKNQTVFYLPEGILNPTGLNHLELCLIDFLPPLTVEKSFPTGYGKVRLVTYEKFVKLSADMADT